MQKKFNRLFFFHFNKNSSLKFTVVIGFLSKFHDKFLENLRVEVNKNVILKEELEKIQPIVLKLKKETSDFTQQFYPEEKLRIFKEQKSFFLKMIEQTTNLFEKISNNFDLNRFFKDRKFFRIDFSDYRTLRKIETGILPGSIKKLFKYEGIKNRNMLEWRKEVVESFRKKIDNRNQFVERIRVKIEDLRNIKVEDIAIRNLKNNVVVSFETSLRIIGKVNGIEKYLLKNYSCVIEFVKENDDWVVSEFSKEEL